LAYGVVLPNLAHFGGPLPTHRALLEYARAARAAGFSSAWAADHVMHAAPTYYAPVILSAVATAIPDIGIGFAAMPAFLRHPIAAANVIASLEILSEGRLEVGLSIGDERAEMAALGVRRSQRGRRLDELLAILRGLATEDELRYQGVVYDIPAGRARPKPFQPPTAAHVFIASWTGTSALERILANDCGWMASGLFSREADLRRGMSDLQSAAAARGRPVVPTILTNVLTCISTDQQTLRRAHSVLQGEPTLAGVRGVRLIGTPHEVRDKLALIRDIGFERVNILPVDFDVAQFEAFMRLV
jgi:alkanesulfonate monooxygenase SsuD/methylene tetrahydromethanopterin reductase-like flavin-dependent oxidoreductase (luciferase family)